MKRLLALLLVTCLCFGAFSSAAFAESIERNPAIAETGYEPIVTEPTELSILVVTDLTYDQDPNEQWFWKQYSQRTGITFKPTYVDINAWESRKALILAGSDLPDVFWGSNLFTSAEVYQYGQEGLFVDLTQYIDMYGDRIKQKFDEYPSARSVVTSGGAIYSLPKINEGGVKVSSGYYYPWINTDWLDKTKQMRPLTLEQFYYMLKKFKTSDANGNGVADEIPLSDYYDSGALRGYILNILGFITKPNANVGIDLDGNAVFMPLYDEYKIYLSYMHQLYENGYLDEDYFTQTNQDILSKGTDNIYGVVFQDPQYMFVDDDYLYEWEILGVMESTANQTRRALPGNDEAVAASYIVTSACKNVDAAVRFADMFYTGLESVKTFYGPYYNTEDDPDGLGFEFAPNQVCPHMNELGMTDYWAYLMTYIGPVDAIGGFACGFGGLAWVPFYQKYYPYRLNIEMNIVDDDTTKMNVDDRTAVNHWNSMYKMRMKPTFETGYPDTVYYTNEQQDKINELQTILFDYVASMDAKFITGVESIETGYKAYQAELEKLGARWFDELYRTYYESVR